MTRYTTTVHTDWDAEVAFEYLARFSNVADWDPSIVAGRHLGGDPLQPGAQYEVDLELFGRRTTMAYESLVVEAPRRIVLRSEGGGLISIDTLTVAPSRAGGVDVTYDADLTLKSVLKLADPLLQLLFNRVGAKARDGLIGRLSEPQPATPQAPRG